MGDAYNAWNEALAARFFGEDRGGKLAYLAVDDDTIVSLAADMGISESAAVAKFAWAVQTQFTTDTVSTNGMFTRLVKAAAKWRAREPRATPPFLAFLGLCVLAASRMATDKEAGFTSANYYRRLDPLIDRKNGKAPKGFESVRSLWTQLDWWLNSEMKGSRGISTVRGHDWLTNIGYPISQCLLAERDRERLTFFFRAIGLEPHEEITTNELYALFRAWVHPSCGLSGSALSLLGKATDEVHSQIQPIVWAEFDEWNGETIDNHRVRGEIALRLKITDGGHRVELLFLPRRPEEFPDGSFAEKPGGNLHELITATDDWYQPLPLAVDGTRLAQKLELESEARVLTFEPRPVIVFRPNYDVSGFVSVQRAVPQDEHCILVHGSKLAAVTDFLATVAKAGWRKTSDADGLPRDWTLLRSVIFVRPGVPDDPDLRCLAPRFLTRLSLDGGLKVAKDTYLCGEEPSAWISSEQDAVVHIDSMFRHVVAGGITLDLRRFDLAEGTHTLTVGESTVRFRTISGLPVVQTTDCGSLGLVLRKHSAYKAEGSGRAPLPKREPSRGEVFVTGALVHGHPDDLPVEAFPPVLLRTGFSRYLVIGAFAGEYLKVTAPAKPQWVKDLKIGRMFFDQQCRFAGQFVIMYGAEGCKVRELTRPVAPPMELEAMPRDERREWAVGIAAAEACDPDVSADLLEAWNQYVALAQDILGEGQTHE